MESILAGHGSPGWGDCPNRIIDGISPNSIVEGSDGFLYGITQVAGPVAARGSDRCGTVFKISKTRLLTTLHSFVSSRAALSGMYLLAFLPFPLLLFAHYGRGELLSVPLDQPQARWIPF